MKKLKTFLSAILLGAMLLSKQDSLAQTYRQGIPPTIQMNPETVEWQRIVYREVDMERNANSGLFLNLKGEVNLFSTVFSLLIQGKVSAYAFPIDKSESFDIASKINPKTILDDFNIPYSVNDSIATVNIDSIPTDEIASYYIKEYVYYDGDNASFRTKVDAICPVIFSYNALTDDYAKYPMFWVKYDDIEPYVCDIEIMPNCLNMADRISLGDYFTRKLYWGDIYKVFNAYDEKLTDYCSAPEELEAERRRIEGELSDVKDKVYDTFHNR